MINCTKTEGMWIGSARHSKSKPFNIKWPDEPIKELFTYDIKLLHEENFIEKLILLKKLINIWSSRGLSLYNKVNVIKSLLIPKFVYVSSLLPTPKEHGGLRKIDMDIMIISSRLAWLRRIFSENGGGTWKNYLCYFLESLGGLFFINCNYDLKDYPKFSQFYYELLVFPSHLSFS